MTATMLRLFVLVLALAGLSGCASVMDVTTSKPIKQNPTTRTAGAALDDSHIENVGLVNIRKLDASLQSANITVVSYNGIVLLLGQVPTRELRVAAAEQVAKIKRVRQVQNALTVGNPTPFAVRSTDSWLTTKVKTKLAVDKHVVASRVKVVTENGVVYLLGLVSQSEGDSAARIAQQTAGVQRVVKVFEYID